MPTNWRLNWRARNVNKSFVINSLASISRFHFSLPKRTPLALPALDHLVCSGIVVDNKNRLREYNNMVVTKPEPDKQHSNPLFDAMTPAQIARARFKSELPRKAQALNLTKLGAISRTLGLFDRFIQIAREAGCKTPRINLALAYYVPGDSALARVILFSERRTPGFVADVMGLSNPIFLGLSFLQHDPDTERRDLEDVSFGTLFVSDPDEQGRFVAAHKRLALETAGIEKK